MNTTYGLFGPVPKKTLFGRHRSAPDAKALILTSCTYDGLRYDLPPIIAAAHAKGIKVIIDGPGTRMRFPPGLPPDRAGGRRRLRDAVDLTRCSRRSAERA